jgi:hypothetical protein
MRRNLGIYHSAINCLSAQVSATKDFKKIALILSLKLALSILLNMIALILSLKVALSLFFKQISLV